MAILFGTQSNGETLPVLVDQFGNLLAKGIEGPEGPQGPPGIGELPPDPYEGALLGWLNNQLAWIGTPPVPIPPGVFGPITAWNSGLITVEGEIPGQVAQGVYVYQCNADGSIYVDGWDNSQMFSEGASLVSGTQSGTPDLAFDGYLNGGGFGSDGSVKIVFPSPIPTSNYTQVYYYGRGSGSGLVVFNEGEPDEVTVSYTSTGDGTIVAANNTITTLKSVLMVTTNGGSQRISGIRIGSSSPSTGDGEILVDNGEYPSAPNLNLRVDFINGQNLSGVTNRTNNFTIGKYLRIPEQNVARWLYDGNLSKVITTTGIDISRLTGN